MSDTPTTVSHSQASRCKARPRSREAATSRIPFSKSIKSQRIHGADNFGLYPHSQGIKSQRAACVSSRSRAVSHSQRHQITTRSDLPQPSPLCDCIPFSKSIKSQRMVPCGATQLYPILKEHQITTRRSMWPASGTLYPILKERIKPTFMASPVNCPILKEHQITTRNAGRLFQPPGASRNHNGVSLSMIAYILCSQRSHKTFVSLDDEKQNSKILTLNINSAHVRNTHPSFFAPDTKRREQASAYRRGAPPF